MGDATTAAVDRAPTVVGRSLWADARQRLFANRLAMASLFVLLAMAAICIAGPWVTGHPYDRVYADYVRVPARIAAHPDADRVESALTAATRRMRVKATPAGSVADGVAAGTLRLTLEAPGRIDERNLALFERSDLFGKAAILERAADGTRLEVTVPVRRLHFFFGTDGNGRDLLTRTMIGGRVSLAIGLLATGVALLIGVLYGAISGYLGGRVDTVMMRFVEILYSLPFIFFVILLVVFFGRNFVLMFLAVGAIEWLDMARIVRGQTLSIKRQEYVQAAEALGVTTRGIITRHVIPNALGPVVVYMTLLVPKVILLESFLSFLGLGVQEPMTSLGVLIAEGARNIQGAAYLLVLPGIVLVTTLFALNFLGDGLRDALDPKDR